MLIVSVLAALAAMAAQPPEPSWRDEVDPMDWTLISRREQFVALGRPGSPAIVGEYRRYWQRIEYREPSGRTGVMSTATLVEYDCEQGRSRNVQAMTYRDRNLTERNSLQTLIGRWEFPVPASLGETFLQVACPTP